MRFSPIVGRVASTAGVESPRGCTLFRLPGSRRAKLHEIIFEAETPGGKAFDVALLVAIVLSVVAVSLETVPEVRAVYGGPLRAAEWLFTILFTVEYVLRLACVGRPWRYAGSFFGVVDLLAIVPTYLSLLVAGTQSLIVIRALRLLRVFRVLKLVHFVGEARMLHAALRASSRKIIVFLGGVLTVVLDRRRPDVSRRGRRATASPRSRRASTGPS